MGTRRGIVPQRAQSGLRPGSYRLDRPGLALAVGAVLDHGRVDRGRVVVRIRRHDGDHRADGESAANDQRNRARKYRSHSRSLSELGDYQGIGAPVRVPRRNLRRARSPIATTVVAPATIQASAIATTRDVDGGGGAANGAGSGERSRWAG